MPEMKRLEVRAKFLFDGDCKFYIHGATYGPFRPQSPDGAHLPPPEKVETDFNLMTQMGINTLRVYHTPPTWFLDKAALHGLRVLITIPWHRRVLFLDNREDVNTIRRNVRLAVEANAGHPAIMGYFVDNEIPPDLVRWYGARKIQTFLDSLVHTVKKHDPSALASYANFPPTEYLLPASVDFYSFNVYLHNQRDLRNYLLRLQNLAGDKPLVLSEFGMDTLRHPQEEQAALLLDHARIVFTCGLAGTIIFSWTDEWYTDGVDVKDWAFGLVTAKREPKKSFHALKSVFRDDLQPLYKRFPLKKFPKVSVVVCSYNGARTLRDCLRSLEKIAYPDYEVIFVDDGSTDNSQEIVRDFPNVRNIVQPNKGLSVARNVGIQASTGEVVAFTDSDCMADADWLYHLVHTLQSSASFAAVGGPNISPPATDWIQATVAVAPGSPSHVLLTDTVAEHVPGCNMAYYKWALEQIGGFDPEYRKAGDDVDVCWRIMERGYQIGFAAAAVVWHYRRFTVQAYFGQQEGYGEAEALLRYKHAQYFGQTGSAIWKGTVYAQARVDSFLSRPVIYHGLFGTGFFQSIYPRPMSPWAGLLGSLEWAGLTLFIFLISIPLEWLRLIPLVMFGLTLIVALSYMTLARIEPKFDSLLSRLLLLYLALVQPWRRAWARYFTWLRGKRTPRSVIMSREETPHTAAGWLGSGNLRFWSESGVERTQLLSQALLMLESEGWKFYLDTGWTDFDVHIFASRWWNLRLKTMTEIYPHGRRLTRVGNNLNPSTFSTLSAAILITGALLTGLSYPRYAPGVGIFTALIAAAWLAHGLSLRWRLAELLQVAAIRAGLYPVSSLNRASTQPTKP
jgi:GT2 family glycosyltransferase